MQDKRRPRFRRRDIGQIPRHLLLLAVAFSALFPLYFMFISAFKSHPEYIDNIWGLPQGLRWQNFVDAFVGNDFLIMLGNSAFLTVASVILSTIVAVFASYAIALIPFHGRDGLLNTIATLMVVPPIVMVIPLFVLMNKVDLIDNYLSVILIYVGLTLPFSVYMLVAFFRTIPATIMEAATVDGCTRFWTLIRIVIPLSWPAIVTLLVVHAVWVWNELLIPLLFLQSDGKRTLMVGITYIEAAYNKDIPVLMAGLIIATVPMIILYVAGQKQLIRGLVAGSLKE